MHLLLAQKGTISQGEEAIDLGQSAADMVFLSAADTELSSLVHAYQNLGEEKPSLRLANVMALEHPMSVDSYIERTARHARLVVVRILGGVNYWPYGLQRLQALALEHNIALAVLAGDKTRDTELERFSTLPLKHCHRLWQYLIEGGSHNARNFLAYCAFLLGRMVEPPPAKPLMRAGLWWPDGKMVDVNSILEENGGRREGVVVIVFYRALVESGQTAAVANLVEALAARGLTPLPIFITSLKDELSCALIETIFDACPPDIVLNATGFTVSGGNGKSQSTILDRRCNMVLQVTFSSTSQEIWQKTSQGLSVRDLAMNIALPEMDGRVFSRAVSFKTADHYDEATQCSIIHQQPVADRVDFVADLTKNWLQLKNKPRDRCNIALILANYPGGDGRLCHGVGLDTPAAACHILQTLKNEGYDTDDLPQDSASLIQMLMNGPTNEGIKGRIITTRLDLPDYMRFFARLPSHRRKEMLARWGKPEQDAYFDGMGLALPVLRFGRLLVGLQPERAYGMDAKAAYHAPDIAPSHHYMAFYFFLRHLYKADALVHIGKHGNLEWLPGKALALSDSCYPELALGATPHIYPFIVNDPGEGTQAKRRTSAVIVDHMTPPLTRAQSYGELRHLEALVDEYYEASGMDPRRLGKLRTQILDLVHKTGIDHDAGIGKDEHGDIALQKLDAFLCDVKELQIRDGLHIFGMSPQGEQLNNLLVALVRIPRGEGEHDSLHRALARDLRLNFDPLDCDMTAPWQGERPPILASMSDSIWRSNADTVERVELLCLALVSGKVDCGDDRVATKKILKFINQHLRPLIGRCGQDEMAGLLRALNGRFVMPGSSGAPTRGRLDVLPMGRNFFSLDNRAVPTHAAWDIGKRSAELTIARYVQEQGVWPRSFALTCWGSANMRTGGDDIAQALAFIGARPVWDMASNRVTGYEIIPLSLLRRPRVDVTLRISGFFRDAFPEQIVLFDQAIRAIGALEGEGEENPIAMAMRNEETSYRIFGTKSGSYGTGIEVVMKKENFCAQDDFGKIWLAHSSYAYGSRQEEAAPALTTFKKRLGSIEAIVQNQDNREHDLLDSGEYYAFEGGMAAAIKLERGQMPVIFHNDLSRPSRLQIKTLSEEIGRTLRGRALNPKWIEGAMRHGFKGAAEMAATVDYLYAFAVTTGMVRDAHFDAIYTAYLKDARVLEFLQSKNPAALRDIACRLNMALKCGLWHARTNSTAAELKKFMLGNEE